MNWAMLMVLNFIHCSFSVPSLLYTLFIMNHLLFELEDYIFKFFNGMFRFVYGAKITAYCAVEYTFNFFEDEDYCIAK